MATSWGSHATSRCVAPPAPAARATCGVGKRAVRRRKEEEDAAGERDEPTWATWCWSKLVMPAITLKARPSLNGRSVCGVERIMGMLCMCVSQCVGRCVGAVSSEAMHLGAGEAGGRHGHARQVEGGGAGQDQAHEGGRRTHACWDMVESKISVDGKGRNWWGTGVSQSGIRKGKKSSQDSSNATSSERSCLAACIAWPQASGFASNGERMSSQAE